MNLVSKTSILAALLVILFAPNVLSQTVGTCDSGSASADLDANNVRARLLNNGGLFPSYGQSGYEVPKDGGVNAIEGSSIWIGGLDASNNLRFAGAVPCCITDYFPGPLLDSGDLPNATDCSEYDRIFLVSQDDLAAYDTDGTSTPDMLDWPYQLGAPVVDGDGDPDNYDLAAGDRPEILGAQTAWWVMNDVGNTKTWSDTAPIGLEVQVTAFAYKTSDALDNTTFYKYKLIHKGSEPLHETYFGMWSDPNIGNPSNDFAGSDSTLGLGYIYNADHFEDGRYADGAVPPALGYALFQGPLIPDPDGGAWTDPDGTLHPDMKRLSMSKFVSYTQFDDYPRGDPWGAPDEQYYYLQGLWLDGTPITFGGTGLGGTQPANFMFPGDPVTNAYWTERNTDGLKTPKPGGNRQFVVSAGPFDLNPGDTQEIIFGIVWARGADFIDSIIELKSASCVARAAINPHAECNYARPNIEVPSSSVTLLSPAEGVSEQSTFVRFAWFEELESDLYFEIQVATDADFADAQIITTVHNQVEHHLAVDTQYWWRVRRVVPGKKGPWSDAWRFSTGDRSTSDDVLSFLTTSNAAGPIIPPTGAAAEWNGFPIPERPSNQQVGEGIWFITTGGNGDRASFESFVRHSIPNGWDLIVPWDWEIRFTERCYNPWHTSIEAGDVFATPEDGCYAYDGFSIVSPEGNTPQLVPYEIWNVGVGTPDDPSDDFRMIPAVADWEQDGFNLRCIDHEVSVSSNDPESDWTYWYMPSDATNSFDDYAPGEGGYERWKAALMSGDPTRHGSETFASMVWVNWNGGDVDGCTTGRTTDYFDQEMPEPGTVFRIVTGKPSVPILASPEPDAVVPAGPRPFYWSTVDFDTILFELRSDAGFALDSLSAEPGMMVDLPSDPANYTWRVRSAFTGWSPSWSFAVVSSTASEDDAALPRAVELSQNYPNPFNPTTSIQFGLPTAAPVSLEIFDVIGRRVRVLLRQVPFAAGYHQTVFTASDLPSGVYLYRLTAGSSVKSGRMILVK